MSPKLTDMGKKRLQTHPYNNSLHHYMQYNSNSMPYSQSEEVTATEVGN